LDRLVSEGRRRPTSGTGAVSEMKEKKKKQRRRKEHEDGLPYPAGPVRQAELSSRAVEPAHSP